MSNGEYDLFYATLDRPMPLKGPVESSFKIRDPNEAADLLKVLDFIERHHHRILTEFSLQIWLRNLQEPLIPFASYDQALQAARTGSMDSAIQLFNQVTPASD